MPSKKCETVHVAVTDEQDVKIQFTMPAFTVEPKQLKSRVNELMKVYLAMSMEEQNLPSLADFALFLLTFAAQDPARIEV